MPCLFAANDKQLWITYHARITTANWWCYSQINLIKGLIFELSALHDYGCSQTCDSVNCNTFWFDCLHRFNIILFQFIVLLIELSLLNKMSRVPPLLKCPLSARVPKCLECSSAQVLFECPSTSGSQVLECPKCSSALSAGVLTCSSSTLSARVPKCPSSALSAQVPECLGCLERPSASISKLVSQPVSQLVYSAGSVS